MYRIISDQRWIILETIERMNSDQLVFFYRDPLKALFDIVGLTTDQKIPIERQTDRFPIE
jgi:hypothetical protein